MLRGTRLWIMDFHFRGGLRPYITICLLLYACLDGFVMRLHANAINWIIISRVRQRLRARFWCDLRRKMSACCAREIGSKSTHCEGFMKCDDCYGLVAVRVNNEEHLIAFNCYISCNMLVFNQMYRVNQPDL